MPFFRNKFQQFSRNCLINFCKTLKLTLSLPRSQCLFIVLTVCHTCDIFYMIMSSMSDSQNFPGTVALGVSFYVLLWVQLIMWFFTQVSRSFLVTKGVFAGFWDILNIQCRWRSKPKRLLTVHESLLCITEMITK